MNVIAYILLSGVLGVAGQLILKHAMTAMGPVSLSPTTLHTTMVSLALNPGVILGLAVYASGTFLWLIVLSRVDLSYAYPFASLNYVMVLFASWLIFGEQPTMMRMVGVVSICAGVWAISRTPSRTRARDLANPAQIGAHGRTPLR